MLGDQRNRGVVAGAGSAVIQRLVQVGCTLLLMPILLRALGAAGFGIWGAAASLAWMVSVVDIGTGSALVTLVARSVARGEEAEARNQVTGALTIGSCIAGLLLALAAVAWVSGAWEGSAAPYLIAFTGLAINVPLSAANNVWLALQKAYVSGFWDLVQTVVTTAGLIYAATATHDVRIFVALVYAGLIVAHLGSLAHLLWSHPQLRPRGLPESLASIREVAGSGILFFILGVTGSLSYMLDNVLALRLLGPEASAAMTIAMRICVTAISMLAALSQPLWPAFTDAVHRADRQWIRHGLLRGSAIVTGVAAAGSAVLLVAGKPLLRLWLQADLGIGIGLLCAIGAWVTIHTLLRTSLLLLNALHLIRFQIGMSLVTTAVAFGLKFVLAATWGASGILWATTFSVAAIAVPASSWRIYRWADHSAGGQGTAADQFTSEPIVGNPVP
jgi:O-antigen/teichoic acid export membrane protein